MSDGPPPIQLTSWFVVWFVGRASQYFVYCSARAVTQEGKLKLIFSSRSGDLIQEVPRFWFMFSFFLRNVPDIN